MRQLHILTLNALALTLALLSGCLLDDDNASPEACAAFCTPTVVNTLDACFADGGEPIDADECNAVCMDEALGGLEGCVEAAGDDCAAVEACLDEGGGGDDTITPVAFTVSGTDAVLRGVIDARAITAIEDLLRDHPEVTRVIFQDCPGSVDDTSNLRAARLLRDANLTTHVPADGVIASGGVDLFLAGTTRTADVAGGARLGVHSWGSGPIAGADVPRDDPAHQPYLDYYAEMGIPADFYWFTLDAAGADDIHWMTAEEIARYGLLTQ